MTIVSPSTALLAYPCLSLNQSRHHKIMAINSSEIMLELPPYCYLLPGNAVRRQNCATVCSWRFVAVYRVWRYIECGRQSNCCMIGTFFAQWLMDVTWRWSYVVVLFSRSPVIVTLCLDMGSSSLYSVLWKVGVRLQDKTKINILQ